jgi:hypothetical protein
MGGSPALGDTEIWNGTNWTNKESMSTGRHRLGGDGVTTSALVFSGQSPPVITATEEWDGTGFVVETLTTTSDN